jgi:hypothetical protein
VLAGIEVKFFMRMMFSSSMTLLVNLCLRYDRI